MLSLPGSHLIVLRVVLDLKSFNVEFSSLSEGIKPTSSTGKASLQDRNLAKNENIHQFALAPSTSLLCCY